MTSFFREVCGLSLNDDMDARAIAYARTCESACWWWPHREFVMVSERPTELHRDERGRLHNESGPSIAWPDGWGFHTVHGVQVPHNIIEHPESVTVAQIDAESNAEVRRVMVERFGRDRYMRESGAKLIDEGADQFGKPQRLWRREWKDGRVLQLLEVVNSSPEPDGSYKVYWLGVHPELRPLLGDGQLGEPQKLTAHNACASTFGKRGEEYHPVLES
jgi:hypothetical protein